MPLNFPASPSPAEWDRAHQHKLVQQQCCTEVVYNAAPEPLLEIQVLEEAHCNRCDQQNTHGNHPIICNQMRPHQSKFHCKTHDLRPPIGRLC